MIEQLEVRNYRALTHLELRDASRINLVAGQNNAGKTSLLEAIFLLSAGGHPRIVVNGNVLRTEQISLESDARSVRDTLWKPMFSALDTSQAVEITAQHHKLGLLRLELELKPTDEVKVTGLSRDQGSNLDSSNENMVLRFHRDGDLKCESSCRLTEEGIEQTHPKGSRPLFAATIILSRNGDSQRDATHLGVLRRQKRSELVLAALREIEPRLRSIEDNSASGSPMIWGDVGLSELVPLPIMGEGMVRVARLVLAIASASNGVVLVDEVESGIHHTALPKMWRAVDEAARQFNTQVFATTHSFECVQAADETLAADALALHRLEVEGSRSRCITYTRDDIGAAIQHGLEVR